MKVEVLTSGGKSFLWLYFGAKSADFLNCIIRFYFSLYKCRFSVFIAIKIKVSRTFKHGCCVARFVSKGFEELFNLQSDFFRQRAGSWFWWKILFFMMSSHINALFCQSCFTVSFCFWLISHVIWHCCYSDLGTYSVTLMLNDLTPKILTSWFQFDCLTVWLPFRATMSGWTWRLVGSLRCRSAQWSNSVTPDRSKWWMMKEM